MKNTLVLLALLATSLPVYAMDLTGIDLKEIPITQTQAERQERAAILATPQISMSDWAQMTPQEQAIVKAKLEEIDALQQAYLQNKAQEEQKRDQMINPQNLCTAKFGKGYEYSGRVETDGQNGEKREAYLCASFGPSKRTPFEKRMIQIEGFFSFLNFKLWHPLTSLPE